MEKRYISLSPESYCLMNGMINSLGCISNTTGIVSSIYTIPVYQMQLNQRFEVNQWLLIIPLVVAPLFEEWLFRGVLLTKLNKRFSFEMSNMISAFLFAAAHLQWFILGYFLNGLVYGWVMKKSGRLYSVIILHALYNAVAILVNL